MLARLTKVRNNEDGFTMVELLVVILIIGILAAIAIPVFLNQQKAAINSSVKSDVRSTVDNVALFITNTNTPTTANNTTGTGPLGLNATTAPTPSLVVSRSSTTIAVEFENNRGYTIEGYNSQTKFSYSFVSKTGLYSDTALGTIPGVTAGSGTTNPSTGTPSTGTGSTTPPTSGSTTPPTTGGSGSVGVQVGAPFLAKMSPDTARVDWTPPSGVTMNVYKLELQGSNGQKVYDIAGNNVFYTFNLYEIKESMGLVGPYAVQLRAETTTGQIITYPLSNSITAIGTGSTEQSLPTFTRSGTDLIAGWGEPTRGPVVQYNLEVIGANGVGKGGYIAKTSSPYTIKTSDLSAAGVTGPYTLKVVAIMQTGDPIVYPVSKAVN